MKSQNGWPVHTSSTHPDLVAIPRVAGRVRRGDVATIFTHLIDRFDREVEDVDEARGQVEDDWGWAYRPVRGAASGLSNHASGTAIDLNAPKHPLGKRGTFTKAQVNTIHLILAELGGVVRWGGDYKRRKDEMHFEIVGTPAQVAAVAKRLTTKPKESSVPTFRSLMAEALTALRAARGLTKSRHKRFLINLAIVAIQRVPNHKESKR